MPIISILMVLLWCGLAVGAPAGGDLLTGREFLDVFLRRSQPHYSDTHNAIPHKGEHDHAFDDDLDDPTTTDFPDVETTTELDRTTTEGPTTLVETTRIERSTTEADWKDLPSQVVSVRVSSSVVRARPEPQHEDKTVSVSYRVEAKVADSVAAASQLVEDPIKVNNSDYTHAEGLTYHRMKLGDDPANTPVSYETSISSASSGSTVRFYRQPPSYSYRNIDNRQQRNLRDQISITDAYAKSEVFQKPNSDFFKTRLYENTPIDYSKPEYSKPQEEYMPLDFSKSTGHTNPPQDFTKPQLFNNHEEDFSENNNFGQRKLGFSKPFSTPLPEYSKPPIFTGTESYVKLDQHYSKSEQVFSKPEAYAQPEMVYAKSDQIYNNHEQIYGKSEVYNKREQVFEKPEEIYSKREQIYRKPEENYEKPEQSYRKNDEVYSTTLQVFGKSSEEYNKADNIYGKSDEVFGKPAQLYSKAEEIYNKPEDIYIKASPVLSKSEEVYKTNPEQRYQKSEDAFTKSEEAYVKAEENFGKRETEFQKVAASYNQENQAEELPKPERVYAEPERVYGEPERNYEIDEAVSVATNGRAHGAQDDSKDKHKFGYVVEGRNFRKYRVEERTADGFIVGEYGVVSHDDGSLRGVRYTADSNINPRVIYDALIKFLSLK